MFTLRCPICDEVREGRGPEDFPFRPFCSDRCRLIDLGRWLGEAYRVPAAREEEPAETDEDRVP